MAQKMTERQQDVKALLDDGKTPTEIAATMQITENAVYQHMRRMREAGVSVPRSNGTPRRGRPPGKKPAAKPQALVASTSTHVRDMTPLQAVRARRDAITAELRESTVAVAAAQAALKAAAEVNDKASAKHAEELAGLNKAEAALGGKPGKPKPKAARAPRKASSNGKAETGPALVIEDPPAAAAAA